MRITINYFNEAEDQSSPLCADPQWLASMAIAQELKNITAELKKLNKALQLSYSE